MKARNPKTRRGVKAGSAREEIKDSWEERDKLLMMSVRRFIIKLEHFRQLGCTVDLIELGLTSTSGSVLPSPPTVVIIRSSLGRYSLLTMKVIDRKNLNLDQ